MKPVSILILENEALIAADLSHSLVQLGYRVMGPVFNNDEVITLASKETPDLVLMDYISDGSISSIDTARHLQEILKIPVVFITAHVDHSVFQNIKKSGSFGYIMKPLDINDLYASIEMALYRYDLENKLRESERRYFSLFYETPIPLYRSTVEGQIIEGNRAFFHLFGVQEHESPLKINLNDLYVNPKDRETMTDILTAKDEISGYPLRLKKIDGTLCWVENNARTVRDESGALLYYEGSLKDITERVIAEKRVNESSERLKLALEATDDGIYDYRIETKKFYCNRRFYTMFGYAEFEFLPARDEWLQQVHPEDREATHSTYMNAVKGDIDRYEIEYRIKNVDSRWLWILNRGKIVERDEYQRPARLVGTHIDISERKKTEEALRKSKEEYRALVNSITEVIFTHNTEGIVTYISPTISQFSQYSPEDLLGKPFVDYIHPDDVPMIVASYERVLQGAYEPSEFRIIDKDGTLHHVRSASRAVIEHGVFTGVTGIMTDLTAEKKLLENLKQSEAKYRHIIETMEDGYYETDTSGNLTFFNDSMANILGYTREELTGKNYREYMSAETSARVFETFNRVYRTGITEKTFDWELLSKDGEKHYVETSVSVIRGNNDKITGFRGLARDITERTITEEKIHQSLLEKEVLLKEIHHRVKNNFQIITSLLNLQINTMKDSVSIEFFKEIQNRIRAMSLIHEKLYQSPDISSIDFSDYINKITNEVFHAYSTTHPVAELNLELTPVFLSIDSAIPCGLIINELITNALKYAFEGTGSDRGTITVSLDETTDGIVTLTVADNGIGLPSDINPENSKSLGLFLTALLVKQLKGSITIEREKGTRFIITFSK